jgi:pyrrolysyl-tRNA synthetase-like protein
MSEQKNIKNNQTKKPSAMYYRKRVELFRLIDKIKLWPSRRGVLHGIKSVEIIGNQACLTTHCNKSFYIYNSRNSRAARWLRNKWFYRVCDQCGIPEWKLAKYASTKFKRRYGSFLDHNQMEISPIESATNTEET